MLERALVLNLLLTLPKMREAQLFDATHIVSWGWRVLTLRFGTTARFPHTLCGDAVLVLRWLHYEVDMIRRHFHFKNNRLRLVGPFPCHVPSKDETIGIICLTSFVPDLVNKPHQFRFQQHPKESFASDWLLRLLALRILSAISLLPIICLNGYCRLMG